MYNSKQGHDHVECQYFLQGGALPTGMYMYVQRAAVIVRTGELNVYTAAERNTVHCKVHACLMRTYMYSCTCTCTLYTSTCTVFVLIRAPL